MAAMALEGIRVLDLSRLAPGPFCTMILGDLGADVIKVEGPREGRLAGMAMMGMEEEKGTAFNALERNKRSIMLNLKVEAARQVLYKLVEGADVVVEGFRPGVVKRLAVDYDTLKGINPGIVYCSITGFGQDGPYSNMVGHDINYISIGGALGIMGPPGGRPTIPSNLVADYAAGGMNAAIGILAALIARGHTGRGQHVDIGMADGVVSLMAHSLMGYFASGQVPERGNDMLTGALPFYGTYKAKDGKYLSIGSLEPWFWENLCRALGREDLIPHQHAAGEAREKMFADFTEIFATKTRDEWFDYLSQWDICVGKVYGIDELHGDPQLKHRRMIVELDHPTLGTVRQAGISQKLSDTPGTFRRFGPLLGEHTDEVLAEAGYSRQQREELKAQGAIG
ncbi:MAG: CaiB/BaiF CoA-transferase family protein [Chloroflexota bacterium]|nr:CaiB/BaiF CoA-transferase family protein [Chloroflexota bacterium]